MYSGSSRCSATIHSEFFTALSTDTMRPSMCPTVDLTTFSTVLRASRSIIRAVLNATKDAMATKSAAVTTTTGMLARLTGCIGRGS